MEAVNYFIVSLDKAYDNEVETSDGNSIIVNSTIEKVEFINRVATIVAAPDFTILEVGDKVVVHHNIFRLRNGTSGNVIESSYHIGGNEYFVPLTEVFMYKREEDWQSLDPYCFVKPIEKEITEGFSLGLNESSYKGKENGVGIMAYPNKNLLSQGIKKGDKVKFTKNSEYEFNIDGVLYYKMSTRDIVAIV